MKPAKEFKPWNTTAVPPPESYSAEPVKKKGPPPGMDMAIKWSNVYEDNGEDAPKAHTGKAQFLPPEEQLSDSGWSFSVETLVHICLVSQSIERALCRLSTSVQLCSHCWTDEEANKDKTSTKKRRVETFQQKEKRKRDMGQATSDKTFVEEEKRILRQKLEWSWNIL